MPARKPKKARARARPRRAAKARPARKKARARVGPAKRPKRATARPKKTAKRAARPAKRATAKPRNTPKPPAPNAIGVQIQHLDFTTHDFDGVKRFYGELLGFTHQKFDPQMDYISLKTGPNSSIGFSAPMPGPPEQWRPPREPALYFIVENVDATFRALEAKGVKFEQPPTNMVWGHRACWTHDPEGRIVYLAQRIGL